ncbi:MAG: hypothetical protein ACRC6I_09260 [Paracoccaceae bacterium]
MARSLRFHASAIALALVTVTSASHAQDGAEGQLSIPFSALSASAQQEILLLQQRMGQSTSTSSVAIPVAEPVARDVAVQPNLAPILADDRKVRIGWAVGVYR